MVSRILKFAMMGAGPQFNPYDFGTPRIWLDASDLATGAAVASWTDKTGNGYHATQSDANKRPIVQSDGVYFDGVDDGLTLNPALWGVNGVTICILAKYPTHDTERTILYRASTVSSRGLRARRQSSENIGYIQYAAGGAATVTGWAVSQANKRTLLSIVATGSNYRLYHYVNGSATAELNQDLTTTVVPTDAPQSEFTLGARYDAFQTYFRGHMMEVLAFDGAISAATLGQVYTALAAKWGT